MGANITLSYNKSLGIATAYFVSDSTVLITATPNAGGFVESVSLICDQDNPQEWPALHSSVPVELRAFGHRACKTMKVVVVFEAPVTQCVVRGYSHAVPSGSLSFSNPNGLVARIQRTAKEYSITFLAVAADGFDIVSYSFSGPGIGERSLSAPGKQAAATLRITTHGGETTAGIHEHNIYWICAHQQYYLECDPAGGQLPIPIVQTVHALEPFGWLQTPIREGFRFAGWYGTGTHIPAGQRVTEDSIVPAIPGATSNVTRIRIVANWSQIGPIIYDGAGKVMRSASVDNVLYNG